MRHYIFLLIFTLLSFIDIHSQEENFKVHVIDKYITELKLDESDQKAIATILLKYKPLFEKEPISNRDYNVILKKEALEIYEILSKDQFSIYKKIQQNIEPNKKFRTKG